MMATTELDKIPETVLSRSQVYEFRTIASKAVADQLRRIVDAEGMTIGDDALRLIARDAEGSMRDAQSKLDQVIAFTGTTITLDDVSTVLGLVGRDLVLDAVHAVADEDAAAAFALTGRAVELGYDLRLVCRELTRVVRDLLLLSVDPSRVSDPEIAGDGESDRLTALAGRFSREDLLRAFDVLAKAEVDVRGAAQPRYHLEMALLRWIHLRKLIPIEDLIAAASSAARAGGPAPKTVATVKPSAPSAPAAAPTQRPAPAVVDSPARQGDSSGHGTFKDAFLSEIRKSKVVFYQTVVAQAQRIDVGSERIVFAFVPAQRAIQDMFEQQRAWLESLAQKIGGRKIAVAAEQVQPQASSAPLAAAQSDAANKQSLREQAMSDAGVKALLEVFPAEIRDVEEM